MQKNITAAMQQASRFQQGPIGCCKFLWLAQANDDERTDERKDEVQIRHCNSVLPQSELEFSFAGVSITPSEGGFHGPSPERIELTGA
jgi:hypothetical protein